MAKKKRNAVVIYYSCTGNTAGLADEAAEALEQNGWLVRRAPLGEASEELAVMPDFLVLGVPVHYWTVPTAAGRMIGELPSLEGVPAFVFCAYGGCVHHGVTRQLALGLGAKGVRIAGAAVVMTPHSCPVPGGKRLGDIEEKFGMGEPDPATLMEFRKAVISSAERSCGSSYGISPESLMFSNAGLMARFINRFVSLRMKIASMPGIKFNEGLCSGCGKCIRACANGNYAASENGKIRSLGRACCKCFACAMNCPTGALSTKWRMIEMMVRGMNRLAAGSGTTIVGAE